MNHQLWLSASESSSHLAIFPRMEGATLESVKNTLPGKHNIKSVAFRLVCQSVLNTSISYQNLTDHIRSFITRFLFAPGRKDTTSESDFSQAWNQRGVSLDDQKLSFGGGAKKWRVNVETKEESELKALISFTVIWLTQAESILGKQWLTILQSGSNWYILFLNHWEWDGCSSVLNGIERFFNGLETINKLCFNLESSELIIQHPSRSFKMYSKFCLGFCKGSETSKQLRYYVHIKDLVNCRGWRFRDFFSQGDTAMKNPWWKTGEESHVSITWG